MGTRCIQSPVPKTNAASVVKSHAATELAAKGDLALLQQQLINNNHDSDAPQVTTGLRPLHYAASRGHLPVVVYLVEKAGATVDATDREGEV